MQASEDQRERGVSQEPTEAPVPRAKEGHRVAMVPQDHLDQEDQLGNLEHVVNKDLVDQQDHRDLPADQVKLWSVYICMQ